MSKHIEVQFLGILRGLGYEPIRNKRRMKKINNIFKSFE